MISPSEVSAIVIAVSALVAAFGSAIATVIAALRTGRKVDSVQENIKEIHTIVNSTSDKAVAKLEQMQSELDMLRRLLSESNERAVLLAQRKDNGRKDDPR